MVELDGDIFLEREGGEKRRKEKEKERGKKGRGRRKNLWTSHVRIPLTDVRQTNYACSIVVLCTCASWLEAESTLVKKLYFTEQIIKAKACMAFAIAFCIQFL